MSNAIFPKFPGLAYSTFKRPTGGNTIVQTSASGKEVRIAQWSPNTPIWDFTLTFNHLRSFEPYQTLGQVPVVAAVGDMSTLIANDMQALAGFFLARQGKFDSWLFDDPVDNWVHRSQIGIGNASDLSFQVSRQLGEFTEDLQNLNGSPIAAPDWQPHTPVALNALILPTRTRILAGGSFASGWQTPGWPVYFKCTTAGTTGNTEPSWKIAPLATQTISDGSAIWTCQGVPLAAYLEQAVANWAASTAYGLGAPIKPTAGNAGGFTYLATTAGTSAASAPTWPQSLGATVADGGAVWTNFGVPLTGALNPIVPMLPALWSVNSTGLLTFNSAPALNAQIFWTSGFYFRCRFKEDMNEFEQFMNNIWKLGRLNFVSIKL